MTDVTAAGYGRRPANPATDWLGWGALAVLGVAALGIMVLSGTRGLDRTDEGLYLNSIARPADDHATILLFGYVYHPVFALVGGNIAALRGIGMVLTVLAGALLAWTVCGLPALVGPAQVRGVRRAVLSLVLGATGLLTVVGLPLTPGYNTLVLQACALCATGLAVALFGPGRLVLLGWALVGIGGWLSLLGKPTTAIAVAALVIVLMAVNARRLSWHAVAAPISTAAAAGIFLLLWRRTPSEMIAVFRAGLRSAQSLGGHGRLIRPDIPPHDVHFVIPAVAVIVLVGVSLAVRERGWSRWWTVAGLTLAAVVAAGSAWLWLHERLTRLVVTNGPTLMLGLLVLPLIALPVVGWRERGARGTTDRRQSMARASFVTFLVLLPPACAFGTNNNLWMATGRYALFWAVAATIVLARRGRAVALAPAAASVLLLTAYAAGSLASPYRYASFFDAGTQTTATAAGARLGLTAPDARLTRAMLDLGHTLGVGSSTQVLDLTGYSPGYIFQLGARSVGQAWIQGGRRGSVAVATLAIRQDPCSLRNALLFVDKASPTSINPTAVLSYFGLDLARDYVKVGTFTPPGVPGLAAHTVTVMRPVGALRVRGCTGP